MQKIPIDLAEPGMILAKPIIHENGMQLCVEETILSDAIIARLKKMQITVIAIKGPLADAGEPDATTAESVLQLNARFAKVKNDPLMERVRRSIEKVMMEAGREEGAHE